MTSFGFRRHVIDVWRLVDVLGNRGFGLQIVFVDDGSDDATTDIAANFAREDERVKTVLLPRNFGHQAAVSSGLANADGDAVVVVDADLQDPLRWSSR